MKLGIGHRRRTDEGAEGALYLADEGVCLRKTVLGWDWVSTRLLCDAIQASAAASVSKRLTVVGFAAGTETLTPNPPASSRII
jgi:hypothetical protein